LEPKTQNLLEESVTAKLCIALFFFVADLHTSAAEAPKTSGLKPGSVAPNFFINTYNPEKCGKKRIFLDKLVGHKASPEKKIVLLSFFNIDCKPCRKELPFLQKLHDRYQSSGLSVVVVNCDNKKEKIAQVMDYINESGFTFPVLKDRFQALQRRYAIASFPTMYFLDKKGVITNVRVGYNEENMPFPLEKLQKSLGVEVGPLK
jgi:thiol-disulfide isomerase/thioredoxin